MNFKAIYDKLLADNLLVGMNNIEANIQAMLILSRAAQEIGCYEELVMVCEAAGSFYEPSRF